MHKQIIIAMLLLVIISNMGCTMGIGKAEVSAGIKDVNTELRPQKLWQKDRHEENYAEARDIFENR